MIFFVAIIYLTTGISHVVSQTKVEGPVCPLDDPLIFHNSGPLNVTLDPVLKIIQGSVYGDLVAFGLSSYHYNFDIDLTYLNITFNLTIGEITAVSSYDASGYLDLHPLGQETVPQGNFSGNGIAYFRLKDVAVVGNGDMYLNMLTNRVSFSRLDVSSIDFSSISADLGDQFIVGGKPVDWKAWSAKFKSNFDYDFAMHKSSVNDLFHLGLNAVLKEYSIQNMWDFVNGEVECNAIRREL